MNFWKNPSYPEGSVRAELHISVPEDTCNYLYDLIVEIAEPLNG